MIYLDFEDLGRLIRAFELEFDGASGCQAVWLTQYGVGIGRQ
jgi:hypothetical protein